MTLMTVAAFAVAGVLATGCHSQGAAAASGTVSATVAAKAPAAPASPATSAKRVPMQTATGGEFNSPTGNLGCEVSLTHVYCQSAAPARSVTMSTSGTYKTCAGEQCLGNSGEGTPTLAYGTSTGVGPFTCASSTAGVTCTTTAAGKGFRISTSGVTPA